MNFSRERFSIQGIVFRYFFLSLVVVFSLFSIFYFVSTRSYLRRVDDQRNRNLLNEVSAKVEEQFQEHLIPLQNLVLLDEFHGRNFLTARDTVKRFLNLNDSFDSLHLYKVNGDLMFAERSAHMPKYTVSANVFDGKSLHADLVRKAILDQKSQISQFYTGPQSGLAYQLYIVPIFDASRTRVVAVACAAVVPKFNNFIRGLQNLILSKRYRLSITNINGQPVVSHSKESGAKPALVGSVRSYAKELKSVSLTVNLEAGNDFFESQMGQLYFQIAMAYIFCLVVALSISILLSRRLSAPIAQTLKTLVEFNRGNFTARANVPRRKQNDDLELLCSEINSIGEKVEKDKFLATLWSVEHDNL